MGSPPQLAGELAQGVWIPVRASPELLDVLETRKGRRPSPAWTRAELLDWCEQQRDQAWSRVMAALGGEYAVFAQLPVSLVRLWDDM